MKRSGLKTVIGKLVCAAFLLICFAPKASVAAIADSTDKSKAATTAPATRAVKAGNTQGKSEILDINIKQIVPTEADSGKKNAILRVDYRVDITISNPKDFILQRPFDKSQLILYADGFPLKGLTTDYFSELGRQNVNDTTQHWPDKLTIPFIFKRDSTNKDAWNMMFHLAHWNKSRITFKMSLGWSGMFPLNPVNDQVRDRVTVAFYNPIMFWVLMALYLGFIMVFIYLCHTTGLIREPDLDNKGPFSLAQTQLAFWTVIIIGGFIYLIILTGLTYSLNNSILLLLGISGGTTGVASFIDYYKKTTNLPAVNTNPANASPANAGQPVQVIQADQQGQPAAPPAMPGQPTVLSPSKKHRTFMLDILSDGVNVSIQRTQTVMWNFVLGLYFIWYVLTNKSMPEFDNTLLLVAGVSSVLYLGSKGPENPVTVKK